MREYYLITFIAGLFPQYDKRVLILTWSSLGIAVFTPEGLCCTAYEIIIESSIEIPLFY